MNVMLILVACLELVSLRSFFLYELNVVWVIELNEVRVIDEREK